MLCHLLVLFSIVENAFCGTENAALAAWYSNTHSKQFKNVPLYDCFFSSPNRVIFKTTYWLPSFHFKTSLETTSPVLQGPLSVNGGSVSQLSKSLPLIPEGPLMSSSGTWGQNREHCSNKHPLREILCEIKEKTCKMALKLYFHQNF